MNNTAADLEELKKSLLGFSDDALDQSLKKLIEAWTHPLTPISVLEVVDKAIHGSLAAGVIVAFLQAVYLRSCLDADTSHEEVVKMATWREQTK